MAIIKPHDIVEIKKGVSIDTLFFPEWALQRWQRQKVFPQAIDSIQALASLFSKISWGIGGSLGYELATGLPTLSARSDIDIMLYPLKRFSMKSAQEWLVALQLFPQKIDVQVEGPKGAFHLEEYARGAKKILLKSASGYLLTEDVWDETFE